MTLKEDKFLLSNLPDQLDLAKITPSMGSKKPYTKSDITKGRNNMKQSINSLTHEEIEDLIDDLDQLASQLG